ncbi:MAG: PKD domain-containing protein [Bacteroidota bacterium]
MEYEGLDALEMEKGGLKLVTSILQMNEAEPFAYQFADTEVPCHFTQSGNTIRFALPEGYEQSTDLIIDPSLIFSTFTGSTANNFGFSATYDFDGYLYAGGIAYGQGYPTSLGAFQTLFGGGSFDISVSKYNDNGQQLYATYVGGTGEDQPHSMIADQGGNLFVMGRSSSADFPTLANSADGSHNGQTDIVVIKLSPNGANLLGSTYVGGSGFDGLNMSGGWVQNSIKYNYGDDSRGEIVLDENQDVYVAACTQSTDFPTSANPIQGQIGSQQDGCVFKLNSALSQLVWSTYLGGTHDDAAYSLKADDWGNVFVTGGTRSSDFPVTIGVVNGTQPGGIDGFITHINSSGTAIISSTYIGTANYDQCYFLELDRDNDVYVVGQKKGQWTVTPGVWSTPSGGQFIMKLTNDLGSIVYQTQFGTSNSTVNISPTAFLVDVCEYVYVSGWGGGTNFEGTTNNLPLTNDAIQSTTDGSDLYIIVLDQDAQNLYFGSYIGGNLSNEHVDGGTSRFNKRAEVYQSVCAGCWANSDFPTTAGSQSQVNNSSGCNLACFKMELNAPGIIADFLPIPDTAGCAPHFVMFDNESNGGNQFFWNFGDPSSGASNTSTATNPSHNFQNPGTYNVMLVAVDSNSCNIVDTAYRVIQVYAKPIATISPDTSVCLGETVNLSAGGGATYAWSPSTGLSGTTGATTGASPTTNTQYQVIVSNPGGCKDTAQVNVEVLPIPSAEAGTGGFICPGDSIQLSGQGGQGYAWSPSGSLTNPSASDPFAFPTATTQYTLTVTAPNGCTDEDTVTVEVSGVRADPGPDIDLCIGDQTVLNGSGGGTYSWFPPTNLSATNVASPTADPTTTTTYMLTVTDALGCSHTDSVTVIVHELPLVDAGPDQLVLCELDSVLLGASGASTYLWTPGTDLSNPSSGTPYAFPTTTTQYVVIGTDIWGCENVDTVLVEVLPAPIATAWDDATICADSSIQVFSSGGVGYNWYPSAVFDDPTLQNPTATLGNTTTLIVQVLAPNGCDNHDSVRVTVTPTPEVQALGGRLVCEGDAANLIATGSPDENYLWSTGETDIKISVRPDSSTWYWVTTFQEGCPSKPDSAWVDVDHDLPLAQFFADPDSGLVPHTVTFVNQSQGSVSWAWDFDNGTSSNEFSPNYTYTDSGRYDVRLIAYNDAGCPDTTYQRVIVGADFTIWVPNIFTPNGDDLNDYFATPSIGVKEFHILIFDRWGMLVYESFDKEFEWDGWFHGKACQEGAYAYVIEASGYLGQKVKKAGTVTIVR